MCVAYMSLCLPHYLEKFPVSSGQQEDASGGGAIREESQRREQKWRIRLKFSEPSDFSLHTLTDTRGKKVSTS